MSDFKVGEEYLARVEGREPEKETWSDTFKRHVPFTEAHRKAEIGEEVKEAREELQDVAKATERYEKHHGRRQEQHQENYYGRDAFQSEDQVYGRQHHDGREQYYDRDQYRDRDQYYGDGRY